MGHDPETFTGQTLYDSDDRFGMDFKLDDISPGAPHPVRAAERDLSAGNRTIGHIA
jgi:hypothetical protein